MVAAEGGPNRWPLGASPSLVVIANADSSHARRILLALIVEGLTPRAVLMASPWAELSRLRRRTALYIRRVGPRETLSRIKQRLTAHRTPAGPELPPMPEIAARHKVRIVRYRSLADKSTMELLISLRPVVIVLAGAPILRQGLIDIPSRGVVNAHPAFLPDARGMDVVEWSVIGGIPSGVTVHLVERGVDSGPILLRRSVSGPRPTTIAALREAIEKQAAEMMVEAVRGLLSGTLVPQAQDHKGTTFAAMPSRLRRQVDEILRRGA